MADEVKIRDFAPDDREAVLRLYPAAFPEEDLTPLVAQLLDDASVLSLVAEAGGALIGHAAFSRCEADGEPLALLGPLAVAPERQRAGVGGALVREGLARVADKGMAGAVVLGDPAYYGRFGFEPGHDVAAPYPLPTEWAEAWRLVRFDDRSVSGVLGVPKPWRRRELWA